jgi:integrase
MAKRLTDRYIKSLKPPAAGRLQVADEVVRGLFLRIGASGAVSWLVRYRPRRQAQKGAGLGPYPRVGLAKARKRAREILSAADDGVDLVAKEARDEEVKRRAEARARTVRDLVDGYDDVVGLLPASEGLRSYRLREMYLRLHILPALGDRVLSEIRRADVIELLDDLEHRKGLRQMTNRVRACLRVLFEYAIERELVDANPVAGTRRRNVERERDRVLADDEIRTLWHALDTLPAPVPAFVRTLLLTGARRENVRVMAWDELDLAARLWTVPAIKAKTANAYEIPLSRQMVELLEGMERRGPFVFTRDGSRPISGMSAIKAALDRVSGLGEWRLHDLRRTLRTGLARLGVVEEIAERVIGHVRSKLIRTYDLHQYRAEKAEALQRWADHVTGLVAAEPGKIVRLDRVKA